MDVAKRKIIKRGATEHDIDRLCRIGDFLDERYHHFTSDAIYVGCGGYSCAFRLYRYGGIFKICYRKSIRGEVMCKIVSDTTHFAEIYEFNTHNRYITYYVQERIEPIY